MKRSHNMKKVPNLGYMLQSRLILTVVFGSIEDNPHEEI